MQLIIDSGDFSLSRVYSHFTINKENGKWFLHKFKKDVFYNSVIKLGGEKKINLGVPG